MFMAYEYVIVTIYLYEIILSSSSKDLAMGINAIDMTDANKATM